jgi:UTP--glucose-1-phosphate uridylyltransferase
MMHAQANPTRRKSIVRKAVIPAAGLGTRLFPATKVAKKELFPIIDGDGIAKPAILHIVEETLNAGLEEIIIITGPGDREAFEQLFVKQMSGDHYSRLPFALQEYSDRILAMGRHVEFAIQPTQEGFGHAVHCARGLVGDEPFLLLLGDHLYHTYNVKSCTRQLVEAFNQCEISVVGLRLTPEDRVSNYGTAGGRWLERGRLLGITQLVEKPTVDYARGHLNVPALPAHHYLTLFGNYIIKPQVFDYLGEHISGNLRERGEFQLTTALERLRSEDGLLGLIIDGESYDIGLPGSYLQTLISLGQKE